MAGVQANADFILQLYPVNDGTKLFKAASHFRPFACHGFQQHRGLHLGIKHQIQSFGNLLHRNLCALAHMGAGMEVIQRARQQVQPMEIICHGNAGEFQCFRLCGAGIDGVGGMGDQWAELVFNHQLPQSLHIDGINLLGFSTPGIPGEELRGIAA